MECEKQGECAARNVHESYSVSEFCAALDLHKSHITTQHSQPPKTVLMMQMDPSYNKLCVCSDVFLAPYSAISTFKVRTHQSLLKNHCSRRVRGFCAINFSLGCNVSRGPAPAVQATGRR